ncbi:MAG: YjjW family glycine radical enzyme activase [Xanthomonadales bacterium]|nr:YjjW family glycine radical enzyme activase [Xanthomonadales bacterium]
MSSGLATVSKILSYSCVDGPGNRFVIFLQGCNLSCLACHNPHTIGLCNHCGECVAACHANALSMVDGRIAFDPLNCDQCDACLVKCPISANPMVRQFSVVELLDLIRPRRPFLNGVTVSGGEATLQLEFVCRLFQAIRNDPELAGLSCFVDSNGQLGASRWKQLLAVTDGVMLDVKAFSESLHRALTGGSNLPSLQSARVVQAAGKLYELRYLLVPGKTDREPEVDALIRFVLALGEDVRVKLNAYQLHGVRGAARAWEKMPKAGVDAVARRLRAAGLRNVVTPAVYV